MIGAASSCGWAGHGEEEDCRMTDNEKALLVVDLERAFDFLAFVGFGPSSRRRHRCIHELKPETRREKRRARSEMTCARAKEEQRYSARALRSSNRTAKLLTFFWTIASNIVANHTTHHTFFQRQ